jgi:hypothetical protein
MVMAGLLLAAALQAPLNQVRFDCEIPLRRITVDREPWRLTITLDVEGPHITSVLLDGPPTFSSYRPIRVRRGHENEAAAAVPQLLPRNMQWRGSFQGRALRLRREGTDMVLEPVAGAPGSYSGFWTYVQMVEYHRVEANGSIRCRTIAGTLSESAHP